MSILQSDDQLQAARAAQTALADSSAQFNSESQSTPNNQSRVYTIILIGVVAVCIVCLVVKYLYPFQFLGDQSYGWLLDRLIPRIQKAVGKWSLGMMLSYPLALTGIFLLERFYPAVPTQKAVSTGLVTDAIWVLVRSVVEMTFFAMYSRLLYRLYSEHLSFLTLSFAASLPLVMSLVIGLVVSDFLQWIQHWLHHKIKWLWAFHAVHHSQHELNVLTDFRAHFMEYVVRRPVVMLPMMMLGLNEPAILWWLLLVTWHTRLNHSNVKFNFGWLRYVIVTPQSHRIHHSLEPRHINHNYGAILSVWDYLFDTQVREYDVYPATGINDEHFPNESPGSLGHMLGTVAKQLIYPFRKVWEMARG